MGKSRSNHAHFKDDYTLRTKKTSEPSKKSFRNLTKQWELLVEDDMDEYNNEDATPNTGDYFLGELDASILD
jgi:hypothetical protein